METHEKWYSVKEVSAILGWSVDTIRRLIRRGHLRAVQLPGVKGGNAYYRVSDRAIKRFLDTCES